MNRDPRSDPRCGFPIENPRSTNPSAGDPLDRRVAEVLADYLDRRNHVTKPNPSPHPEMTNMDSYTRVTIDPTGRTGPTMREFMLQPQAEAGECPEEGPKHVTPDQVRDEVHRAMGYQVVDLSDYRSARAAAAAAAE